ncbi:MAG: peptidylprolyl isomerase, partial [Alphaproteobacteria bacterium]
APKLDEVKADIVQKLQSDAVDKAIAGLLDSANIERTDLGGIDPSLLSDPSLFE